MSNYQFLLCNAHIGAWKCYCDTPARFRVPLVMINTLLKMTENFWFPEIWLIVPRKEKIFLCPVKFYLDYSGGFSAKYQVSLLNKLPFTNHCLNSVLTVLLTVHKAITNGLIKTISFVNFVSFLLISSNMNIAFQYIMSQNGRDF